MNEYIQIGLFVLTLLIITTQLFITVFTLLDSLWDSRFTIRTLIGIITLLLLTVTIPFGYWVINL